MPAFGTAAANAIYSAVERDTRTLVLWESGKVTKVAPPRLRLPALSVWPLLRRFIFSSRSKLRSADALRDLWDQWRTHRRLSVN